MIERIIFIQEYFTLDLFPRTGLYPGESLEDGKGHMEDYKEKKIGQTQELQIIFEEEREITEEMTPLGGGLYRLEETPVLFDLDITVYWGDIIEAEMQEDGVLHFKRCVDQSEWRHWSFLFTKKTMEGPVATFKHVIEAYEGRWEQIFGGFLLVHLLKDSPFDPENYLKEHIWSQP